MRFCVRWLIGIAIVLGLATLTLAGTIGGLPIGLLSEHYLSGKRLPLVISLPIGVALALALAPVTTRMYAEAYRALRRAERGPG